ncbi:extracellular solute-binding protein [Embleya sp. NBC_00896]|uniref:extracellular solute-binding protein n=1 Tax=Embleya sp. NBC_00896 TaxID=2975961 RepID=UPI003870E96A|nr:extracellular solute-binding protein [Embleya sp. NBC_00896]
MPSWNDDPEPSSDDSPVHPPQPPTAPPGGPASGLPYGQSYPPPPPPPTYAPTAAPPPPQQQYPQHPQHPNMPPPPGWAPPPPGWAPQPPPAASAAGSSRRKVIAAGSVAAVVAAGGGVAAWLLTRGDDKAAGKPGPGPTTNTASPPPPVPDVPTAESGPYTLTMWLDAQITPGIDQTKSNTDLTAALLKADPYGTLKPEVQEFADNQKLDAVFAAGQGPDLFQTQTFSLARHVLREELLDLTPYASRLNIDAWHPAARAACTVDGKLYALPMDVYAPVVLYDKRLCDPAGFVVPRTRDEWIAQLDNLKKHYASDPKFEALHMTGKAWTQITSCLYEDDCAIAERENGRWVGRLGTAQGKAGISFFQRLQAYSAAPKDVDEGMDPAGSIAKVLAGGKAAMVIQPAWMFPDLVRTSPETARNTAAFPIPGRSADKPSAVAVWSSVVAVSAKTAHPAGAVNLLRVLGSATWQQRWADENETVPALTGVTTVTGSGNAMLAATLEALKQGRPYPQAPGWTSNPLKEFAVNVLAKGIDPSSAGRRADALIAGNFDREIPR